MKKFLRGLFVYLILAGIVLGTTITWKGWRGNNFSVPGYAIIGDSVLATYIMVDDSAFIDTLRANIIFGLNGEYIINSPDGEWQVQGSWHPTDSASHDLGKPALPWHEIYTSILYAEDYVEVSSDTGWTTALSMAFPSIRNVYGESIFNGYLYVGIAQTGGGEVWKTQDGTNWTYAMQNDGFNDANNLYLKHSQTFNDYLYMGTYNDVTGGEIWRTRGDDVWTQVNTDGFGDVGIIGILSMAVFNNVLYAGVDDATGAEIWRTVDGTTWTRPRVHFSTDDDEISYLIVFNNYLYAATENEVTGTEVWRSSDGRAYAQVNIDGFGTANNTEVHSMEVFNGYLYACTENSVTGGEVWRTLDGTNWTEVVDGSFGTVQYLKELKAFNGFLYVGTTNASTGTEVWRTEDGTNWTQANTDGFGDANIGTVTSFAVFKGYLYTGTDGDGTNVKIYRVETGIYNEGYVNVKGFSDGILRINDGRIENIRAVEGRDASFGFMGTNQLIVNKRMEIGTADSYSRQQIWNYDTDAVLRLGAAIPEGDHRNTTSEGICVYGTNVADDAMSDTEYGLGRIKSNRFGLLSADDDVYTGYLFRVDLSSNGFYLRDNAGNKTFEYDRLTGFLDLTGRGHFIDPTRTAGEYHKVIDVSDAADGLLFTAETPAKTYVFNTEVRRVADSVMTGDSRDVLYKGTYRNYAANDASSQMQGIGISVRNELGGTFGTIKGAEFGVNTKSGATSTNVTGLEAIVEHYSAGATTNLYGAKIDLRNEGTEATNQYGLYITNTDNSTANASDASIYVTDAGTNTGWDYGLDLNDATIGVADIRGHEGEIIFNNPDGTWDFGAANLATTGSFGTGNITITVDDPFIYYDPSTVAESEWWTGVNHDAIGDDNDNFEIRQSATPGTSVELCIEPDGDVITTGDLIVTGSDVSIGVAGVKLSGDGDGAITFLGLGNGTDEDFTLNLDDAANTVTMSTTTGLVNWDFGPISTVDFDGTVSLTSSGNNLITLDGGTAGVRLEDYAAIGEASAGNNIGLTLNGGRAETLAANESMRHLYITGNISEFVGASTHPDIVGAYINNFTVTSDATAVTTNCAGLYVVGAPTHAGTVTNGPYALFVDAGESRFDGDIGDATNRVPVVYGVDIDASDDILLADGAVVGITGNEIITFNEAGSINFSGASVDIDGALTSSTLQTDTDITVGAAASDNVTPTLSIIGDADADAAATVSETIALTLTANADPTLATWGFTNTQCAGYTFDNNISATTYGSDGSVSDTELLYVDATSSIQTQLDARCLESVFGTSVGTGLTLDGTALKTHTSLQSIAGLTETTNSIVYAGSDNTYAVLATNATATDKYLRSVSSGAPSWEEIVSPGWTVASNIIYNTTNNDDVELRSATLAHGMTSFASTNAYAVLNEDNGVHGGLRIRGLTDDAGTNGIDIGAATTQASPTDYPMKFQVGKKSGTTWAPFSGTQMGFAWYNNTQLRMILNTGGNITVSDNSATTAKNYHQLGLYHNSPSVCLTDIGINLDITSAATAQDSNAIWLDCDDVTPEIGISGGDGDAWDISINTSDGALFENATTYNFDNDVVITGDLSVTGSQFDYGEMGNVYGSDATEALNSANVWHAMYHANINSGLLEGWTYTDGSSGGGNITTAQGGLGINIADAAHGLVGGDIVCVQSANHNGINTVTYVDAGNFEVTIGYVGDEAGTWQEGSYLQCATAGKYRGVWTSCCKQSLANAQTTTISPYINTVQSTKATAIKYLGNANDVAAPAGNGLMNFSVGDRIWFGLQSTAAQTITFKVRNVTIAY